MLTHSITNIYPILASTEHKAARLLVIAVGVLHAAVAIAMKLLFYSYTVDGKIDGTTPGGEEQPVERALRALANLLVR